MRFPEGRTASEFRPGAGRQGQIREKMVRRNMKRGILKKDIIHTIIQGEYTYGC